MNKTSPAPELRILRPQNRVRYLKLIALFKIGKGVLLVGLGASLLFLNSRTAWLDAISDWAADEILLQHGPATTWLLNRVQAAVVGEHLRATAFVALFYAAILCTEGIGVYLQRRWGELLMVFATAALIPVEVRHLLHRPSVAAGAILAINCFIVWFLYRVLRRDKAEKTLPAPPVRVETVSSRG